MELKKYEGKNKEEILKKILKELNIKVPQEVKVFGYDDSEVALISTKTISTVRQPVDER